MDAICVIPARYGSTRFPGKPLALLGGKPIIQWVYERARKASTVEEVFVATDDTRISEAIQAAGGKAVMTSPDCASGTDRIAEAVSGLDANIVVNVQGGEPLIDPATIDRAVESLRAAPECAVSTPAIPITDREALLSPHVVKVVFDKDRHALYFSRSPIPSPARREEAPDKEGVLGYKHLGLYVYRREALEEISRLSPTELETIEKLEQLRFLEHGYRIKVVVVDSDSVGIDTPEELEALEREMSGDTL